MHTNPLSKSLSEIRHLFAPQARFHRVPVWTKYPLLAIGAAFLLSSSPSSHAYTLAQQTETFSGGLGNWTTVQFNNANGYNFGYQNSGNANGTPGELGGLIVRSNSTSSPITATGMPYVLDTASFASQTLSLNDALTVKGTMWVHNISAGCDLNFGYFNLADPNQRFILNIRPSGTDERYRLKAAGVTGGNLTAAAATYDSTPLEFSMSWIPSGLNDGSGTFSGLVALAGGGSPLTLASFAGPANTFSFNSFGLWIDSASTTDLQQQQNWYFDNVEYTVAVVPEPSVALLALLVAGGLLRGQRKQKA